MLFLARRDGPRGIEPREGQTCPLARLSRVSAGTLVLQSRNSPMAVDVLTVSSKGQIVLPAPIRSALSIAISKSHVLDQGVLGDT